MKLEEVKKTIRDIYDFPQKGIIFRDLTTAFKDADALCTISEELKKRYEGLGVTKVVGIESRGFIGGAVLARDLGASLENCLPTLSASRTARSMVWTLSKSTATLSLKAMWWCFTMICSLLVARWLRLMIW